MSREPFLVEDKAIVHTLLACGFLDVRFITYRAGGKRTVVEARPPLPAVEIVDEEVVAVKRIRDIVCPLLGVEGHSDRLTVLVHGSVGLETAYETTRLLDNDRGVTPGEAGTVRLGRFDSFTLGEMVLDMPNINSDDLAGMTLRFDLLSTTQRSPARLCFEWGGNPCTGCGQCSGFREPNKLMLWFDGRPRHRPDIGPKTYEVTIG